MTTTAPLLDRTGRPLPVADLERLWPLGGWTSLDWVVGGKNEHLRLVAADGVHYLRRSYRSKPREELVAQLSLERLLRERGFPAPEVVPTASGLDHAVLEGRLWTLTRAVVGAPFDDASPGHLRALGRTLARYHATVADLPAPAAEPAVLAELRGRAQEPGLDPRLLARAQHVVSELTSLLQELPRTVVHGGARRGSLLFAGDEVVGVLDFDSAHPDVRVLDLAVAVHDVGKVYTSLGGEDHKVALDLDRVDVLVSAYSAVLRPTPAEVRALPLLLEAKRLKRALGRMRRAVDGERLSDNDHAKIRLEDNRLRWLDDHREAVTAACRRALA